MSVFDISLVKFDKEHVFLMFIEQGILDLQPIRVLKNSKITVILFQFL